MGRFLVGVILVGLSLATRLAAQGPSASTAVLDLSSLDRTVDPCSDFFQFTCGGWRKANRIPADRARWGAFDQLQDRNFTILRRILETPAPDAAARKAADYYAACVDEAVIDRRGVTALEPHFARITALTDRRQLAILLARLHAATAGFGVSPFFSLGSRQDLKDATRQIAEIDEGSLGLPDRDFYLKDDPASAALRQKYRDHVTRTLTLSGMPATEAASNADAILSLETTLAKAQLTREVRRDPASTDHMMPIADVRSMLPAFDLSAYLKAVKAPRFIELNIASPAFMRAIDETLYATPLPVVKAYLRWQLLRSFAAMLPAAFRDADFEFYGRALSGQKAMQPRWRRCVTSTDAVLGEALGKAFVDQAFGPDAKADVIAMIANIKNAMKRDIASLSWMSLDTKQAAVEKLEAVADRIGYPERWRDYSAVKVSRDDALGNLQRAGAFEWLRTLRKIGQPVDRSEFRMTPPTVNAYYARALNSINFPAGILQLPFYAASRDAAFNYGGAGAVIGHELTHGFDDQGRKFDGAGNLRDWWTAADAKSYEERASCIAGQYSQYVVAGDTKLNGRLTLGENTADNGGVRLALMAYLAGPAGRAQTLDGLTPEQRFFVGYGQIWCESRTDEFERLRAATDTHSSGRFRINGVLSNMPEFQRAFACKPDAAMVRANACRVW